MKTAKIAVLLLMVGLLGCASKPQSTTTTVQTTVATTAATTRATTVAATVPTTAETSVATTAAKPPYIGRKNFSPEDEWNHLNEEWLEICATHEIMTGWRVSNLLKDIWYNFPSGFVMNGCVKIRTGSGTDTLTDFYLNRAKPIWKEGERAMLYLPNGTIADQK